MKKYLFSVGIVLLSIVVKAQRIDGGSGHALLICKSGEVFAVGENSYGQVGDSLIDTSFIFQKIPFLDDIIAVEAGAWHSMALRRDGSVWVWGGNDNAQLVDGTGINSFSPKRVDSLGKVTQISAGWWHSLFLLEDSTVWGGGSNSSGELGVEPPPYGFFRPNKTPGLNNIIKIAGGYGHSLSLDADGILWAFGENGRGQLGNGTTVRNATPSQVGSLNNIIDIAAGWNNSYAIEADGSVWAWGSNRVGQLGTGAAMGFSEYSSQPVKILTLDSVVSVKTVAYSAYALKANGTVWAWGDNSSGQLGDGTTHTRNSPIQVQGLKKIVEIGAASGVGFAIDELGVVYTWGGVGFTLASDTISQKLTASPISSVACNPIISIFENIADSKLTMYPNPTTGIVFYETTLPVDKIEILNSSGIRVKTISPTEGPIDMTSLPKGVFFMVFLMDGQFETVKVIRQ